MVYQAAPSKLPVGTNTTSEKQEGLSNSNTKHSLDLDSNPEKSKKGEGVVETAKVKGPVDPGRPQVASSGAFILVIQLTFSPG